MYKSTLKIYRKTITKVCMSHVIDFVTYSRFKKKIINKHASQLSTIEIDKGNQNPKFIH